jgi:hypothetical protein
MAKRGRKSAAELITLATVRPRLGADRELAAHDVPAPPDHLSPATKAWWNKVLQDYEVQDHALRTLQAVAEAWDLKETARAAIARHGRPEVQIAKNALAAYFRGLNALNLKTESPHGHGLQPAGLFR